MLCARAYQLRKPDAKVLVHGAVSHVFCRRLSLFEVEMKRRLYGNNIPEDAHTSFVFNV
jgi:hypothetical protein